MNLYVSIAGLLIAGLLLFFSKNRRLSLFGLAWFVFFLLPGIIVTNPELKQTYQFEHRAFVPMLGIMLMILAVLKNRLPSPSYRWYHYTVFLACLGVLALRSSRYAEQFSSPLSFFSMTAENSPSCTICAASLGTIYSQQGRAQEAVEQYRKAIRLEPDKIEFYTNLSLIHLNQNQAEKAREVIDQAKALQIDSLLKAKRLAEYYLTTRRLQQARRYLKQAESIDSTDAEVNRIRTHLEKSRIKDVELPF